MIIIKYGWDAMKQGNKREFEESFETEKQAVEWTNSYLQELGADGSYETLTEIEIDVYSIFGDTGAEIERA